VIVAVTGVDQQMIDNQCNQDDAAYTDAPVYPIENSRIRSRRGTAEQE
jgi:hypothetical protein